MCNERFFSGDGKEGGGMRRDDGWDENMSLLLNLSPGSYLFCFCFGLFSLLVSDRYDTIRYPHQQASRQAQFEGREACMQC